MPRASRFSKVGRGRAGLPGRRLPGAARGRQIRAALSIIGTPMSTARRLGVVMDPMGAIAYAKDSTLAMLLAAERRGFALSYLELGDLMLRDGVAFGRTRPLTVRADPEDWFTLGEPVTEPLGRLDCILMRKDPALDIEYVYSTYILERAETEGVLVVTRPQGLRDMNEKVYTAWFPQCCAATLVTRDMGEMGSYSADRAA